MKYLYIYLFILHNNQNEFYDHNFITNTHTFEKLYLYTIEFYIFILINHQSIYAQMQILPYIVAVSIYIRHIYRFLFQPNYLMYSEKSRILYLY